MIIGTWQAGGSSWKSVTPADADAAIRCALEAGYRKFDTAPTYGDGAGEEKLGKLLAQMKISDACIITKVPPNQLSRAKLQACVEGSLRRLGVDQIDTVLIHWPPGSMGCDLVSHEEVAESLRKLKESGLAAKIGVSNYGRAELVEFQKYVDIEVVQYPYSVVHRAIEMEVLPYLAARKIEWQAYATLGEGLLAPGPGPVIAEGDHRNWVRLFKGEIRDECLRVRGWMIDRFGAEAFSACALKWVMSKGLSPVIGIHKPSHLELLTQVGSCAISSTEIAEIDAAGAALAGMMGSNLSLWE